MDPRVERFSPYMPQLGCLLVAIALAGMCLLPFLLVDVMQFALSKLHLNPTVATLAVVGIIVGGLINLPIYRFERGTEQVELVGWSRVLDWTPVHRSPTETILAVNVGGCVLPVLLAVRQLVFLIGADNTTSFALVAAVTVNIVACFLIARPVPGVGIMMPGFVPPILAVGFAWLLLLSPEYNDVRAPVAFIAGTAGPLIGADLFHLRDITRISAGVLSIGGAGTFDGIVLSGFLAALLA